MTPFIVLALFLIFPLGRNQRGVSGICSLVAQLVLTPPKAGRRSLGHNLGVLSFPDLNRAAHTPLNASRFLSPFVDKGRGESPSFWGDL